MKVEYITHMGDDLTAVNAARVSFDKESDWINGIVNGEDEFGPYSEYIKKLSDKDKKLVDYLAKHKHMGCFEHQTVTLRMKVPIFVARQIHRHRTFAYNEVSRRYVKDNLEFYWPDKWRKSADNVKQGSSDEEFVMEPNENDGCLRPWEDDFAIDFSNIVEWYNRLVKEGMCAEQARMILPQNLYTTFYMTGNLRNWVHFLKLRLDSHAQREVQEVAQAASGIISGLYPDSFEALMRYE